MDILLDFNNMSRFLNRILGIRVQMQNILFRFFSDVLNAVIVDARRSGSWDLGILGKWDRMISWATASLPPLDLGTGEETVSVERSKIFVLPTVQTNTIPLQVELHEVGDRVLDTTGRLHWLCFHRSLSNGVWPLVKQFNWKNSQWIRMTDSTCPMRVVPIAAYRFLLCRPYPL